VIVGVHRTPAFAARCAITSLAFMLLLVPEPVWKTSIGNCGVVRAAATAAAAASMAAAMR
jgi:hypothetical protein